MSKSIFDFRDYREYLSQALPTKGEERGCRTKLALCLGVQKGTISSVLNGNADFSLEQAFRVSTFLSHSDSEREYFLLLVQTARAGSKELQTHYSRKMDSILKQRREISEHIQAKTKLTEADQLKYYSTWQYAAVHLCLRVPRLRTPNTIAAYLGVPIPLVTNALEFLVTLGAAKQDGNTFSSEPTRMHIPWDADSVSKHHTNWRLQAIRSLDQKKREDLHYSVVMSVSRDAAEKIRRILLESIQAAEPVIREARDEAVYTMAIDLFELNTGMTA